MPSPRCCRSQAWDVSNKSLNNALMKCGCLWVGPSSWLLAMLGGDSFTKEWQLLTCSLPGDCQLSHEMQPPLEWNKRNKILGVNPGQLLADEALCRSPPQHGQCSQALQRPLLQHPSPLDTSPCVSAELETGELMHPWLGMWLQGCSCAQAVVNMEPPAPHQLSPSYGASPAAVLGAGPQRRGSAKWSRSLN